MATTEIPPVGDRREHPGGNVDFVARMDPPRKRLLPLVSDPSRVTIRAVDLAGRITERAFIPIDQRLMRRNRNLVNIPWRRHRTGGKVSYGEWAWVIGLMQSLIASHLPDRPELRVIDVGCGSGLVSIATLPLLGPSGTCLGLDVKASNIEFCRSQHTDSRLHFEVLDLHNAAYAPSQTTTDVRWPAGNESTDLVTALSVWTHLDPVTATASLAEAARVLRPGGKALISFFIQHGGDRRLPSKSAYHRTPPAQWVFDEPVAPGWSTPGWTSLPEQAIAVDRPTLDTLANEAGLQIERIHDGYWREQAGLYFQDIVVLTKPL